MTTTRMALVCRGCGNAMDPHAGKKKCVKCKSSDLVLTVRPIDKIPKDFPKKAPKNAEVIDLPVPPPNFVGFYFNLRPKKKK